MGYWKEKDGRHTLGDCMIYRMGLDNWVLCMPEYSEGGLVSLDAAKWRHLELIRNPPRRRVLAEDVR